LTVTSGRRIDQPLCLPPPNVFIGRTRAGLESDREFTLKANRALHKSRSSRLKDFLRDRWSPEGVLGLHLTVGLLVLVLATWLFASIAEDVVNRESLTVIDVNVSNAIHNQATKPLTVAMLVVSTIHNTVGTTVIALIITLLLVLRRLRYWALAFALSVYGGMLLNALLKSIFQRARPHFDEPIVTLTSYGFPSGHTMMATTLYGALCAFVISRVQSWLWRVVAIIAATFLIALVGFSRIYLGAHYLSDVLAAMVEALFWLALCLTAVDTMQRWKNESGTSGEPGNV